MPNMGIGEQKDYVTINQEKYDKLLEDQRFLECLQAIGVDNWDGYDEACKMFREEGE